MQGGRNMMSKVRLHITVVVASIAIFIGLFAVDNAVAISVQFHPSIFLIICLAVLAELILPSNFLTPLFYLIVTVSTIIMAGLSLFVPSSNLSVEAIGGLIIELAFLAWIFYLVHVISSYIRDYEMSDKLVRLIGIEDPSTDIQSAMPRIHADLTRSRHYQRPLSVIVLNFPEINTQAAIQKMETAFYKLIRGKFTLSRLAKIVHGELRAMDFVLKDGSDHNLILVCPEIGPESIPEVTKHLEQAIQRELGIRPRYASASFPDDGLTFDGLRQRASENLERMTRESDNAKPFDARPKLNAK
jgi:hypothetical protein